MAAGLSVTPLSASGFGGLLEGVELSALLDSPSQLRRAWFQARGLLLLRLRGEALTPAQMVALTSLFGSVEQELDVMMAVSTVRRSRPQFVTGLVSAS